MSIISLLLVSRLCAFAEEPANKAQYDEHSTDASLEIGGFLGIKWGSTKAAAKEALVEKGFSLLREGEDRAAYHNGKFAGLEAKVLILSFSDDRFNQAIVVIEKDPVTAFKDLDALLSNKYGTSARYSNGTVIEWKFPSRAEATEQIRLEGSLQETSVTYTDLQAVRAAEDAQKQRRQEKMLPADL